MKLNSVFLMHTATALLGAFLMIAAPVWFSQTMTGVMWPTGGAAIYDLAEAYCRLAALGGVLIALVARLAISSSSAAARHAALRALFWISIAALALALAMVIVLVPFQPLVTLLIVINLVFALAYKYIELFAPQEI